MSLQQVTGDRTTWINVVRPTPKDVEVLRRIYPYIHPLNLEDIASSIERPKIDDDPDYLFTVLHFPLYDSLSRLTRSSEVDFIVGRGYVVTVHDGVLKPLVDLFQSCKEDDDTLGKLLGSGASHAFYVMVDRLVDHMFPILAKVDANIHAIEDIIFEGDDRRLIREIALVRRDIIALRRIVRQQVPIFENLDRVPRPIIHEDLDEYFGDLVDHVYRARDIVDENMEIMTGLAATADSLLNYRINNVIRILTVFSVIMLPLTFISSVYGMNVQLPLAQRSEAFGLLASIMLIVAIAMLLFFRRRGWL